MNPSASIFIISFSCVFLSRLPTPPANLAAGRPSAPKLVPFVVVAGVFVLLASFLHMKDWYFGRFDPIPGNRNVLTSPVQSNFEYRVHSPPGSGPIDTALAIRQFDVGEDHAQCPAKLLPVHV